jgi:hypothetical protein
MVALFEATRRVLDPTNARISHSATPTSARPSIEHKEATMRKLIAILAIAFALAAGTSIVALTAHVDRTHIAQAGPHGAGHQKLSLLY